MGIWKLLLLLAVVLVIFGPGKLPNAIKDIGRGFKSLKDELQGDEKEKADEAKIMTNVTPENDKNS